MLKRVVKVVFFAVGCLSLTGLAHAAGFVTDFNAGLPPGSMTNALGSRVSPNGGVGNSGVLKLTSFDTFGAQNIFYVTNLAGGAPVTNFVVKFRLALGGGSCCGLRQADGMAFSMGNDLPLGGTFGEEGAGTGLIVGFDTWDNNGTDTAPALDVKVGGSGDGNVVAFRSMHSYGLTIREGGRADAGPVLTNSAGAEMPIFTLGPAPDSPTDTSFVDVYFELFPDNTFSMSYSNVVVWDHLPVPSYIPMANASFGFGARTGGASEDAWIDNLSIFANFSQGPVTVLTQPTDQNVIESQTATFSLQLDGTPPYTIQWFSNNVAIPGANGFTYTTPPTITNMNGLVYRADITNVSGSTSSSNAVLTVEQGIIALSAATLGRGDRVFVQYSKPAGLTGVYTLNNGGTVLSSAYGSSQSEVVLTTSTLVQGADYTLNIAGETGIDGVPLRPDPTNLFFRQASGTLCTDFSSFPAGTSIASNGVLGGYIGNDGTGNSVLHLTDDPVTGSYANFYISNTSGGAVLHNLYASWRTRIGGDIAVHADGFSMNWSHDLNPSGAFVAAEDGMGTGVSFTIDTWDGGSGPDTGIEIKWRGNRIAFKHIPRTEEGDGNFICRDIFVNTRATVDSAGRATFTYDTNTITALIPNWPGITNGAINFIARTGGEADNHWIDDLCLTNFNPGVIAFVEQPVETTAVEGSAATFYAVVDGTPRYYFQWFTNGVPVPGATSGSYTTPPTTAAMEGIQVSVVASNDFSSVTSSNATLHVEIGPRVLAVRSVGENTVHVLWHRPVDLNSGFYNFDNGIFENLRDYGSNHNEVVILTDPLTPGTTYTLTIDSVTEEGNPTNNQFPDPTIVSFRHGYGIFCANFDTGVPPGTTVTGSAAVSGGVLHITDTIGGQGGAFFVPDPNAGFPVDRLVLKARTLIGNATPNQRIADGFSINFGADITAAINSEEGQAGTQGLIVTFDTWDNNGTDTAPSLEVRYKGSVLATQAMAGIREGGRATVGPFLLDKNNNPLSLETSNAFVNLLIMVAPDGKLDLYFKDVPIFRNLQLPNYTPFVGAKLNISGRTGGAFENAWFDDLCINAFSLGAVTIVGQPADAVVTEIPAQRAHFTAQVDGLPPYVAQWYSNGVPIPGATALSYITPVLNRTADGAGYYAVISNSIGSSITRTAIVDVIPDVTAPSIVGTIVANCSSNIYVFFSELIDPVTASNPLSYTLTGGYVVTAASMDPNGRYAILTVSPPINPNDCVVVTINGVTDRSPFPNPVIGATGMVFARAPIPGSGPNNLIVIEAEDWDVNRSLGSVTPFSSWVKGATLPGYAGSGYADATPNIGAGSGDGATFTNASRLDYCVNFPTAGTYYIWARGSTANDGGNNSFHLGIDGVSPDEMTRRIGNRTNNWGADPGNVNAFGWVRDVNGSTNVGANVVISNAGIHTVNVWMREDGIKIDRILFTTDSNLFLNVTEIGPPASIRPPTRNLSIVKNPNGSATLSWPGTGWILQGTTNFPAPPTAPTWQNLPFTSPLVIPPGVVNSNVFFRLICP
jgi:hypothetical protein